MDEGPVLDASALLALLTEEPGADLVDAERAGACLGAVNLVEVLDVLGRLELGAALDQDALAALGIALVPFTASQAERAARLRTATRAAGLSLGDRACLALAEEVGRPVLAADRAWRDLGLEVEVRLIR